MEVVFVDSSVDVSDPKVISIYLLSKFVAVENASVRSDWGSRRTRGRREQRQSPHASLATMPLERGKHLELILLISFISIIPAAESGEEVLEEGKGASQEAYGAERDRT